MKVLLINYMETTHPGGVNMVVPEIAKNISRMGHECIVLQPNPAIFQIKKFMKVLR